MERVTACWTPAGHEARPLLRDYAATTTRDAIANFNSSSRCSSLPLVELAVGRRCARATTALLAGSAYTLL
jgi:hypothetical protein